ncbi:NAD(P)-specific glutamate dehydrogenase [Enhygromyxa salina]|uniref:Glutamate dehydrogenase n=1 Tax=Enhygromyxa salina TaxID=215803 RepID=A0A2S9XG15_9BACT|nr:NADP-specific glutamate dehydrogenase [Enhygromyxa salina]PRP91803.1 NAD(P)-specific glutamate dehydrogenase [Enhygromyxa salina]
MTSAEAFMDRVRSRDPNEPEFHQAVAEVVESLWPWLHREGQRYLDAQILERLVEPERVVSFRIAWVDDAGKIQVNRGYRIQMNGAIGPYKGGLRFHPTVTLSVLKFLAFEQVFKNSLTTLAMGGGKGGADFDPKRKSDAEVMRFCQSFMTELQRHIGPDTDVPAGDIGVGGREIGYMFGQYRRLRHRFDGVLTGKGPEWGGSLIRPEATGYGAIYFAQEMLATQGQRIQDKTVIISGSGNVAQFAAEKCIALGAKVVTMSDSSGFIHDPAGIDSEKLAWIMELKNVRRERLKEYAEHFGVEYYPGQRPWAIPCHVAVPCATQNELDSDDAKQLLDNHCMCVVEGANMPLTTKAVAQLQSHKILFGPGKAANAGGVATSGLEMAQNSQRMYWSRERVDGELHTIMRKIHAACCEHGQRPDGSIDYVAGANIAGFIKVANAMLAQGCL